MVVVKYLRCLSWLGNIDNYCLLESSEALILHLPGGGNVAALHFTPASSLWKQLWILVPACVQSISLVSFPLHSTSSSNIGSVFSLPKNAEPIAIASVEIVIKSFKNCHTENPYIKNRNTSTLHNFLYNMLLNMNRTS